MLWVLVGEVTKGFSQMSILFAEPNGHDPISHYYNDVLCLQASQMCYLKWYRKPTSLFARPRLGSELYFEEYVCIHTIWQQGETPPDLCSLRRGDTGTENHNSRSNVLRLPGENTHAVGIERGG